MYWVGACIPRREGAIFRVGYPLPRVVAFHQNSLNTCLFTFLMTLGDSVAEWLVCWTQVQKGPG